MAAKEKGRSTFRRENRLNAICVEIAQISHRMVHKRDAEERIRSRVERLANLSLSYEKVRFIRLSSLGDPGGVELQDANRDAAEFAHVGTPRSVWLQRARSAEEIGGEGVVGLEACRKKPHCFGIA